MSTTLDKKITVYAKVVPEGVPFDQIEWTPWRNTKTTELELMPRMVLHHWIRSRGGIFADESFNVTVYLYDDNTPKYASGRPRRCLQTTFLVNHKDN